MHIIAAKAVGFWRGAQARVPRLPAARPDNAQALAASLQSEGLRIVSGGTDNHLILVDLNALEREEITGKAVEKALDKAGIHTNKNMIPFDPRLPSSQAASA